MVRPLLAGDLTSKGDLRELREETQHQADARRALPGEESTALLQSKGSYRRWCHDGAVSLRRIGQQAVLRRNACKDWILLGQTGRPRSGQARKLRGWEGNYPRQPGNLRSCWEVHRWTSFGVPLEAGALDRCASGARGGDHRDDPEVPVGSAQLHRRWRGAPRPGGPCRDLRLSEWSLRGHGRTSAS